MFKTTTNIGSVACCCWCCCLDADYCADSIRFYTFLNSYLGRFFILYRFFVSLRIFFPIRSCLFPSFEGKKKICFFLNYMFCHWLPFWLLHIHTQKYTYHVRSFLVFNIYFIILMLSISCLLFRQFRYTIFLSLLTCCLKTTRTRRRRTKNSST